MLRRRLWPAVAPATAVRHLMARGQDERNPSLDRPKSGLNFRPAVPGLIVPRLLVSECLVRRVDHEVHLWWVVLESVEAASVWRAESLEKVAFALTCQLCPKSGHKIGGLRSRRDQHRPELVLSDRRCRITEATSLHP